MSEGKKKIPIGTQRKMDKQNRAAAAQARHDLRMRSSGRAELATNYGTKKGDKGYKQPTKKVNTTNNNAYVSTKKRNRNSF